MSLSFLGEVVMLVRKPLRWKLGWTVALYTWNEGYPFIIHFWKYIKFGIFTKQLRKIIDSLNFDKWQVKMFSLLRL